MTQTFAILLDAYRELNHRRLFWIALGLSGLVVAAMAAVGINDQGLVLLVWTVEVPGLNSSVLPPHIFYKSIFAALGVGIWLTWVATILALITTAGIIPDLVASGSIDLAVSKPISRARLFMTKFVGGLLFSTLQVTIFTAASFFVIGVRGGVWEPWLFLAIPLVVLFYSYLYSFCALIGVLTRSTVASLLITILFWAICGLLWIAFTGINTGRIANELNIASIERIKEERVRDRGDRADLSRLDSDLERALSWQPFWERASGLSLWAVTPLPKTAATIDLLQLRLVRMADLPESPEASQPSPFAGGRVKQRDLERAIESWQREFTPTWVVGTSLAFEAVILFLACWIFARRDY
ncbi:MAG: ABC transporter permease subunit [Phycisphaeraceae bacterium]|nr:ABC transporter permease subunit [Phycisphaeraceae bacterium]